MQPDVIILSGEPKSTQHIYKASCTSGYARVYMSGEGKAIKERYQWEAKSQWHRPPLTKEVGVWLNLYFKTKRKHDCDNFNKLILDSLTGIVWEDDNQIAALHILRLADKDKPRAEIIVRPAL